MITPNLVDTRRLRATAATTVFERNSLRLNLWFGAILFICIFAALAYSRWKKVKEEKDEEKEKKATLFLEQLRQKNTPLVSTYGQRVYAGEEQRPVQYKPKVWDHGDGRRMDMLPLTDTRVYDQLFGHQIAPVSVATSLSTADLQRDFPGYGAPMDSPIDLSLMQ